MEDRRASQDGDMLNWFLHQCGLAPDTHSRLRPDFLIISPPKTGSSWLAANLRCHPQIFVPSIKEIKYFSSFMRWLDWSWYLHQFDPAGTRFKGEGSPSYALLSIERIRLVRQLLPEVKLIFLMREPLGRAWSHAKHTYRFREATFAGCQTAFEDVTAEQWRASFRDDWLLASGDYLGQLRRWLSVFPRAQVYIGFYETIASAPERLLREILSFLGVDPLVDLASFPLGERILTGLEGEPPPSLESDLQGLLHRRSLELAAFLRTQLNLEPPPAWQRTLALASEAPPPPAAFLQEFDDAYLSQVLSREECFPSARCMVLSGYRGYHIALHHGRLYALDAALGEVRVGDLPETELRRHLESGRCFVAHSVADVKEQVDRHTFGRAQAQQQALATLQEELRTLREQVGHLEGGLARATQTLHWLETDCRWYAAAARVLRRTWQRTGLKKREP